ncbi:MAG: Leucine-responsive regulatory protein, regulator for leucine (or lrp) regulon and high-affinity branched-chain amino acid transport system, partial [uncultured Pseudonocardia sp.]
APDRRRRRGARLRRPVPPGRPAPGRDPARPRRCGCPPSWTPAWRRCPPGSYVAISHFHDPARRQPARGRASAARRPIPLPWDAAEQPRWPRQGGSPAFSTYRRGSPVRSAGGRWTRRHRLAPARGPAGRRAGELRRPRAARRSVPERRHRAGASAGGGAGHHRLHRAGRPGRPGPPHHRPGAPAPPARRPPAVPRPARHHPGDRRGPPRHGRRLLRAHGPGPVDAAPGGGDGPDRGPRRGHHQRRLLHPARPPPGRRERGRRVGARGEPVAPPNL